MGEECRGEDRDEDEDPRRAHQTQDRGGRCVKARAHVRQRGLEECAARSVGSSALAEGHEACRVDETAHPSQRGELEALE